MVATALALLVFAAEPEVPPLDLLGLSGVGCRRAAGPGAAPWPADIAFEWALWRTPGRQSNLGPEAAGRAPILMLETVGIAAADFSPVQDARGVRHRVSAVWLVREGSGRPEPEALATDKLGLHTEIRLLMDPTAIGLGSDVAFRVYSQGSEAKGGPVRILPPKGPLRTAWAEDGKRTFRLDQPGLWRLTVTIGSGRGAFDHAVLWFERGADE